MRKLLGAIAAATLLIVAATSMATASHVISGDTVAPNSNSHTYTAGNPRCGEPEVGGINVKLEAGVDLAVGVFGPIEITYYDGTYVSWRLTDIHAYDAGTVIVKGGPNAIIYGYISGEDPTNSAAAAGLPGGPAAGSPADLFDDQDYRLTSPYNPNGKGGKYYGISHVSFCMDPKDAD